MDFLNTIMRGRLKSLFSKDFARWKTTFENLVMLHDPNFWIYITQPYEKPRIAGSVSFKMVNQMSATERENFNVEKKTFETILACLPNDEASCFRTQETSFDLWNSLEVSNGSNTNLRVTSSDEGMKEELIKKEEEIKALQSKILTMENEREETRLKIIGIEKKEEEIKNLQSQLFNMETEREAMRSKIVELEEHVKLFEVKQKLVTKLQQPIVVKLIEDKELALKTIEDLRKKIDNISQSPRSPVKNKKKICTDKSSELFRAKKISQFTNYSLHKNNKYSEKSQSTRQRNHQKVDCRDNSGNIKCNKSSASTSLKKSRDLKPTLQPESIRTKSYAYTREQMFAFAPPRFHHMVQNRRKDFASFSWRTSVRRNEFRNETRCLNFRWNSMSLDFIDESYRKVSKLSRKIGTVLKWVPKVKI